MDRYVRRPSGGTALPWLDAGARVLRNDPALAPAFAALNDRAVYSELFAGDLSLGWNLFSEPAGRGVGDVAAKQRRHTAAYLFGGAAAPPYPPAFSSSSSSSSSSPSAAGGGGGGVGGGGSPPLWYGGVRCTERAVVEGALAATRPACAAALRAMRDALAKETGCEFTAVLLARYTRAGDHLEWTHWDDGSARHRPRVGDDGQPLDEGGEPAVASDVVPNSVYALVALPDASCFGRSVAPPEAGAAALAALLEDADRLRPEPPSNPRPVSAAERERAAKKRRMAERAAATAEAVPEHRRLEFAPREKVRDGATQSVVMTPGTVLVVPFAAQRRWMHRVPKLANALHDAAERRTVLALFVRLVHGVNNSRDRRPYGGGYYASSSSSWGGGRGADDAAYTDRHTRGVYVGGEFVSVTENSEDR